MSDDKSTQPQRISDIEGLKALSHPVRMRILEELAARDASVVDLAESLGTTRHRLYYHVKKLAEAGLVESAGEREDAGVTEQVWRAAAKSFTIDEHFSPVAIKGAINTMFRRTSREVAEQMKQPEGKRTLDVLRGTANLTTEQVREIVQRVHQMATEMEAHEPGPDSRPFGFLWAVAPALPEDDPGDD